MTAGQFMAMKRLYVHRSRYDELAGCRPSPPNRSGDGLLPDTTMGR